jgi:hypothetical protein
MFDHEPEKAVQTRRRIYDMASAEKILVCGYHFPFPGLGYIEKAGTGYRLVPGGLEPGALSATSRNGAGGPRPGLPHRGRRLSAPRRSRWCRRRLI